MLFYPICTCIMLLTFFINLILTKKKHYTKYLCKPFLFKQCTKKLLIPRLITTRLYKIQIYYKINLDSCPECLNIG